MSDDTTCPKRTSSAGARPANLLALPASEEVPMTNDGSGLSFQESWARWDLDSSSWKTYQASCLEDWETFSGTWPTSGTTRRGKAYRLAPLVLTSEATVFSSLPHVPRPVACDGKGSGRIRHERSASMNLRDWWNMNYRFVYPPVRVTEYLMGFPPGWTDLEPSVTP